MTVLVKPLQARFLELEDQGKLDLDTVARKMGIERAGLRAMLGFYTRGDMPKVTVTDVSAEDLTRIFDEAAAA